MLNCDGCGIELEVFDAIFIGDSVACHSCNPNQGVMIAGLPSLQFNVFSKIYFQNFDKSFGEIMEIFSKDDNVLKMHLSLAETTWDIFKHEGVTPEDFETVSDLILEVVFLANMGEETAREMVKSKHANITERELDLAFKLSI